MINCTFWKVKHNLCRIENYRQLYSSIFMLPTQICYFLRLIYLNLVEVYRSALCVKTTRKLIHSSFNSNPYLKLDYLSLLMLQKYFPHVPRQLKIIANILYLNNQTPMEKYSKCFKVTNDFLRTCKKNK